VGRVRGRGQVSGRAWDGRGYGRGSVVVRRRGRGQWFRAGQGSGRCARVFAGGR
jgi:hypothetical protein